MENFIAIDFETARPERSSACAVGIVKVINGVITEKYFTLIKPLNNEYSINNTFVHGIDAEMTENCKSFDEVYPVIKNYIEGQLVVAHNAPFDTDVLNKTMELYGIKEPLNYHVICTCELNGGKALDICCNEHKIELNHHEALSDAEACAILYLKTKGIDIVKKMKKDKDNYIKYKSETKLSSEVKKAPNLDDVENKDTIFFGKKVVFTGKLNTIALEREELANIVKKLGADVNTSISKLTNIVVMGDEAGPGKMKKIEDLIIKGCQITKLNEEEFKKIVNL